jgi:hypothetical protein
MLMRSLLVLAAVVRNFLDSTRTQLTMSGLFAISDSLESGEVVAVRISHNLPYVEATSLYLSPLPVI